MVKDGLPHFDALRSRRASTSIVLYAFDLLYLDGFDLSRCPLVKRKALLKSILPKTTRAAFASPITSAATVSDCLKSLKRCNSMQFYDIFYYGEQCKAAVHSGNFRCAIKLT